METIFGPKKYFSARRRSWYIPEMFPISKIPEGLQNF
jgi:hypothetical protein